MNSNFISHHKSCSFQSVAFFVFHLVEWLHTTCKFC